MKTTKVTPVGIALSAAIAAACGPTAGPTAEIRAPEPRQARVALTPALDVTNLFDHHLAERIVLDEITVNIADVRLLGADPRIPSAGLPLIDRERRLSSFGEERASVHLPFPEALLNDEELAIYVRIETAADLDWSSVVVKGRLFDTPMADNVRSLTADPEDPGPDGEPARPPSDDKENPGPDGEPARPTGGDKNNGPDGEPADPGPDGEPARPDCEEGPGGLTLCSARKALQNQVRALPFELRGTDVADLVIDLSESSRLNVILGIPAARWFTPEVVGQLERALDTVGVDRTTASADPEENRVVVTKSREEALMERSGTNEDGSSIRQETESGDDYRLLEGDGTDPNIRQ